jgi:hypothetical protein
MHQFNELHAQTQQGWRGRDMMSRSFQRLHAPSLQMQLLLRLREGLCNLNKILAKSVKYLNLSVKGSKAGLSDYFNQEKAGDCITSSHIDR